MGELEGKVAVVTGGAAGIGRAMVERFAAEGARVVIADLDANAGNEVASALGDAAAFHATDVTDAAQIQAMVDATVERFGGLHVLVNNAGITRDGLSMRMKDDDWTAVLDTNLNAVFRLCRAAMRPMMKQRHGRIVNITSVVGAAGNGGQANYAAAKAGVAGLTRSLARELGSRNVTVNCVAPGFIGTDMTGALSDGQRQALLAQVPLGRLGTVDEVAAAVAFLVSPGAAYITGTQLHVNGGMFMD
jgi:3-oxoacyl-[acyl-carrier protein] reductase